MEQSPADPSSALSVDEVVRIYQRWFLSAPRGFAMLVCQGEAARREVLNRLGGRMKDLHFVDLSRARDAQAVVEAMASSLQSWDSVVFFGFEEALAVSPENARLLNFNRERLAGFQSRQLWVLGPVWRQALLAWGYDLYSWFLPNNTIGLTIPDRPLSEGRVIETSEKLTPGPEPSQAARRSASSLLARFERNYRENREVDWALLNSALEALEYAGAYSETEDLLERALDLVTEIKVSGQEESPQALRDLSVSLNKVGNVQRDLGRNDEALVSYEESLGIRRRLLETYGESPQALRDIALAGGLVTQARGVGNPEGQQALGDANHSIDRAIELYGSIPSLLEVQDWLRRLV